MKNSRIFIQTGNHTEFTISPAVVWTNIMKWNSYNGFIQHFIQQHGIFRYVLTAWDDSFQIVLGAKLHISCFHFWTGNNRHPQQRESKKALKNNHPRFTNDKNHMVSIQASCFSSQNHCQDFNELLMSIRNWLGQASDTSPGQWTASAPQKMKTSFLSALETEVLFTCLAHCARRTRQMFTFPDMCLHQETLHQAIEREMHWAFCQNQKHMLYRFEKTKILLRSQTHKQD